MEQGDDYYDDEDESGPSPLVLGLVGVALLFGLGAAGVAGWMFVEGGNTDAGAGVVAEAEQATEASFDEPTAPRLDEGVAADSEVEPQVDMAEEASPAENEVREEWTASPKERDRTRASATDSPRRSSSGSYSSRSSSSSRSSGSSSSSWSSRGSTADTSSNSRRSYGSSGSNRSRGTASRSERTTAAEDSSSSYSESRAGSITISRDDEDDDWATADEDESSGTEGMMPGEVVGGAQSSNSAPRRGYDDGYLQSLGTTATRGQLDRDIISFLEKVPGGHDNFTLAWATLLKNADAKRDKRGHCNAAQRIMSLPENRYHPEWNLEIGKCQMRNRQWSAAVRSVERTLTDSFGMTAATKSKRILLANEIRAIAKTQLYEKNAETNQGIGDDTKLRSAIQAWGEYKNFARGIGNTGAQQRADKEIADLRGRMN